MLLETKNLSLVTIPEVARHTMTAKVDIQESEGIVYSEAHYHGMSGGIEVTTLLIQVAYNLNGWSWQKALCVRVDVISYC